MNTGPGGRPGEPARTRIEHRGASFEAPTEWQEDSIVVLAAPGKKPQPTLSLNRISAPPETPLDTILSRKIAELAVALAGLEVREMREISTYAGRGILVDVTFDELEGAISQRMLFVRGGEAIFVLTGCSPSGLVPQMHAVFDQAMVTLRLPSAR